MYSEVTPYTKANVNVRRERVCCEPLSLSLFPPLSLALSSQRIAKNSVDCEEFRIS